MSDKQIPRSRFVAAIEAGIARAVGIDPLSAAEKFALREVGLTAKRFGSNFDSGCPLVLAGLYSTDAPLPLSFNKFYRGFDIAMVDFDIDYGNFDFERYEVIDA